MESANLNFPDPRDAQLEAWLRANAQLPALPDHGFSACVLAALPPRAPRQPNIGRLVACLAGAMAGTGLLLADSLSRPAGTGLAETARSLEQALFPLFDPPVTLALGVALLSLVFAFAGDAVFSARRWRRFV